MTNAKRARCAEFIAKRRHGDSVAQLLDGGGIGLCRRRVWGSWARHGAVDFGDRLTGSGRPSTTGRSGAYAVDSARGGSPSGPAGGSVSTSASKVAVASSGTRSNCTARRHPQPAVVRERRRRMSGRRRGRRIARAARARAAGGRSARRASHERRPLRDGAGASSAAAAAASCGARPAPSRVARWLRPRRGTSALYTTYFVISRRRRGVQAKSA